MTTMTIYGRFALCVATWRHHSEYARLVAERRRIGREVRKVFETLCDTKCRALKATGVRGTEHRNLEEALLHLARALDDYNDAAMPARIVKFESAA
jgi:hypothetical protein